MSSRATYIAGAIFIAAFGLYFIFDLHRPAPTTSGSPQPSPLINLDPTIVSQFQVKSGGKTLTVIRSGAEWRYSVCPTAIPDCPTSVADTSKALRLLGVILQVRPTKTIFGAPEGLPAYGLATATAGEIDVQTPGGRSISLLVGANAPDNTSAYVRLSDSNDIETVPAATIQTQIFGAIAAPPAPVPSPSPTASASPSPSPH